MKFKNNLTKAQLVEKLHYNPDTGVFTWKMGPNTGSVAGTPVSFGYISIGIGRRNCFKAHRLAWLYVHGRWPAGLIDHVDGNPRNNRISNLREASFSENLANFHKPRFNKTGFRGVTLGKDGRFFTQPSFRGQRYFLGSFDRAEEASDAYEQFRKRKDGEFFADQNRVPVDQTKTGREDERAEARG